ncbi:MAG: hypothetical protein JWQ87_1560 [Candidatus Sulfotelmatobacter sp.]|nr:hypothetical protein [Candidatus Sulfotelmatobacter sp.]
MAGRDRCGRGGRRIQCFLLDTIADVGVASRDRHAGSCREMARSEGWRWSSDWRLGRLSIGRRDPCSSRASLADAIRRHRLCLGSIDDAGVFLFRMASGLVQLANYSNANFDLLRATIADAMTAIAIILAMSFGVVAPKMIMDRFGRGSTPTRVVICQ